MTKNKRIAIGIGFGCFLFLLISCGIGSYVILQRDSSESVEDAEKDEGGTQVVDLDSAEISVEEGTDEYELKISFDGKEFLLESGDVFLDYYTKSIFEYDGVQYLSIATPTGGSSGNQNIVLYRLVDNDTIEKLDANTLRGELEIACSPLKKDDDGVYYLTDSDCDNVSLGGGTKKYVDVEDLEVTETITSTSISDQPSTSDSSSELLFVMKGTDVSCEGLPCSGEIKFYIDGHYEVFGEVEGLESGNVETDKLEELISIINETDFDDLLNNEYIEPCPTGVSRVEYTFYLNDNTTVVVNSCIHDLSIKQELFDKIIEALTKEDVKENYTKARNAQRNVDVNTILVGVWMYSIDEDISLGTFGIPDCVVAEGVIGTGSGNIDLSKLVDDYIIAIPVDPQGGNDVDTGYTICLTDQEKIKVSAPNAEGGETISAVR